MITGDTWVAVAVGITAFSSITIFGFSTSTLTIGVTGILSGSEPTARLAFWAAPENNPLILERKDRSAPSSLSSAELAPPTCSAETSAVAPTGSSWKNFRLAAPCFQVKILGE